MSGYRATVCGIHENHRAKLWHWQPGKPIRCRAGKQSMYRVRAEMATLGMSEDGWTPSWLD